MYELRAHDKAWGQMFHFLVSRTMLSADYHLWWCNLQWFPLMINSSRDNDQYIGARNANHAVHHPEQYELWSLFPHYRRPSAHLTFLVYIHQAITKLSRLQTRWSPISPKSLRALPVLHTGIMMRNDSFYLVHHAHSSGAPDHSNGLSHRPIIVLRAAAHGVFLALGRVTAWERWRNSEQTT